MNLEKLFDKYSLPYDTTFTKHNYMNKGDISMKTQGMQGAEKEIMLKIGEIQQDICDAILIEIKRDFSA